MAFGELFPLLYQMNEFSFVHIVVRKHVHILCTIKHPEKTYWSRKCALPKKGMSALLNPSHLLTSVNFTWPSQISLWTICLDSAVGIFKYFTYSALWCSPSCKYACLIFYMNGLRYTLTISKVQWDRLQSNGVAKLRRFLAPASS